MRNPILFLSLFLATSAAAAEPGGWQPLTVAIECQQWGRTNVCNGILPGLIEDEPLLAQGRPGSADVVIRVNAVEAGQDDLVDLRFDSQMPDADAQAELVVRLNTFATDDELRGIVGLALRRGMASFVAARYPDAVRVDFVAPAGERTLDGSPWDVAVAARGMYSTGGGVTMANAALELDVRWTTARQVTDIDLDAGYARLDQGDDVPVGVSEWLTARAAARWEHLVRGALWLGVRGAVAGDSDGEMRHRYGRLHATATLRLLPLDDRRGNIFNVSYSVGGEGEWSRFQDDPTMWDLAPSDGLSVTAAVRLDRLTFGGWVSAYDRLDDDLLVAFQANEFVDWQLTQRLHAGVSADQRRETVAGQWGFDAWFYLRAHWDRSNGTRNVFFTGVP